MTSSNFIKDVAKANGVTQKQAKAFADMFENAIKERVKNGESVKVLDVTFSVKDVPARAGFDPINKEHVEYPETKKITLKPSADLKRIAKNV